MHHFHQQGMIVQVDLHSSITTVSRITSVTSVTLVTLLVTLVTFVTSVTSVMLVISFVINSFVILKTTGCGGGGGIRTTTVDCLNVSTTPLVRYVVSTELIDGSPKMVLNC